jgi:transcriptional regulator with XRE-family HTH domain
VDLCTLHEKSQPVDPMSNSFFDPSGFEPVSVGQRLREIRLEKGFSIRALAEASGLAVNTLSLIENQKSSPSVNTLEQLAEALAIPLASLFEPISSTYAVVPTIQGRRRKMVVDGIRVEDLGLQLRGQPFQPFIVTLPPGKGSGNQPIVHTGYELVYCLSGRIDYVVDGQHYPVSAGDSLLFEAHLAHHWENCGKTPAVYLLLMVPEDSRDAPGRVHFTRKV